MKIYQSIIAIALAFVFITGCDKDGNYPGGVVSPYIAIFDIRDQFKGSDVILTNDKMFGSSSITGVVVSDHSAGNMPDGLLVLQDRRRLNELRGIAVDLGNAAATYVPGDSLIIDVSGCKLTRASGILTIMGVEPGDIKKVSSGRPVTANRVNASQLITQPDKYESTFVILVKAGFNPAPIATDKLAGDKILNDGFGDIRLYTKNSASFANESPAFLANYYGIIFNRKINDTLYSPQLQLRRKEDVVILSSTISVSPILISGFISDVNGSDGNYEYMQFMATRDIDFSKTPYSVVVTNNANASTPTGFPVNGWATGGMRTYKMNMTSGSVKKGGVFYVGGSARMINGPLSTSVAGANWIRAFDYTTTNGDGFGTKTGGLFANSGNASGLAVFEGTNITAASVPLDVIFVGTGGSLYTTSPVLAGYRITNTDWYDTKNPVNLQDQPFYRAGTNTLNMSYTTSDRGFFYKLGGEYTISLGRWTKARTQTNILLTKTSQLSEIEGEGMTSLK